MSDQTLAPGFDPERRIDEDALQGHTASVGGRGLGVGRGKTA